MLSAMPLIFRMTCIGMLLPLAASGALLLPVFPRVDEDDRWRLLAFDVAPRLPAAVEADDVTTAVLQAVGVASAVDDAKLLLLLTIGVEWTALAAVDDRP